MKFVFWYWKENFDFEPSIDLDRSDTELLNILKTWEVPYVVLQYTLYQDKKFIELCKSIKNEKIVFFAPEECRIFTQGLLDIVHEILQQNNSSLEVWIGNFEEKQSYLTVGVDLPRDRINIINWNTLLIYKSIYHFINHHIKIDCKNTKIDRAFVCLNNRVTSYRCKMLESLAKNNLLDEGYVSWLKTLDDNLYDDVFEYFDNEPRCLSQGKALNNEHCISEIINEDEYFKGFVNIITEGEIWLKDLSEKTFYAILHKKPFLILGAPFIHDKLIELGFVLYDEMFDYSFDHEPTVEKRIEGIVKNIQSIKNKDYNELYGRLETKLLYNYNRLIEICQQQDSIPKKFLDYLNDRSLPQKDQQNLLVYYEYIESSMCIKKL